MSDAERLTDEEREALFGVYLREIHTQTTESRSETMERYAAFVREALAAVPRLAARAGDREEWVTGEVPVMIDWCAECDDIATMECQVDHGSRTRPRRAMLSESQALNREPDTAPVTIVMEGNVVTPTEAAQAMLGSRAAPGGETRAEG